jgi:xanthine dehydrogenase YagS FAD-binding subunit
MEQFAYASPKTVKEAVALLGPDWNDAAVLAGGTDLISLMKDYVMSPKRVVNLKGIKKLHGITQHGSEVRIGAITTLDDLVSSPVIRSQFPSLVQAAMGVTSPQMRNMGTVGGDICQRPRCWYFRGGMGLLGTKDGKSLIVDGENRYHAIFGGGPAYFVSASSFGPALVALGAKITIATPTATRSVKAADFFLAPKDGNTREIALAPNEIVMEIAIPGGTTNATYEVRHKEGLDWPLATASVALKMSGKTVNSANIVLGHVAPTPWNAEAAAQMLAGKTIDESVAEAVGMAAVKGASPLSQNEYKVQLAKVAVKRALLTAAGLA